jgi:two-component system heavy metal sensor histidine kinase CusS
MKTWNIRQRMTAWYGATISLLILVFGVAICWLTVSSYSERVDFELAEEMSELIQEVRDEPQRERLMNALNAAFAEHAAYEFEILKRDEPPLFRSHRLGSHSLLTPPNSEWPSNSETSELSISGLGEYRVLRQSLSSAGGPLLMQVAIPLAPLLEVRSELLRAMSWLGPLIVLLAVGGGYWLTGRMLAPLTTITTTAGQITAQRLKRRIEIPDADDELSQLARTLNEMFDRLDRSFDDMRRFTADASHELRTPLAIMRTQLDIALRSDRSIEAYREVLESVRDDVQRMSKLASQLLELAREDAALQSAAPTTVVVNNLIAVAIEQLRPKADERNVSFAFQTHGEGSMQGDEDRLQRVVLNVLDNALKYSPEGGVIAIELHREADSINVRIADAGPGISAAQLPRVFDRFFRADASRSSPTGTGLGLAISQAIVRSHGGTISLVCPPEGGTVVSIRLPLSPVPKL